MNIHLMSIFVNDQSHALAFYTEKLGFKKKQDVPLGTHRWLTVVSPHAPNGTELLLEPNSHPAVAPYTEALKKDGIPQASFTVENLQCEFERLSQLDVVFVQPPLCTGTVKIAILDDTCGNLIQLIQM